MPVKYLSEAAQYYVKDAADNDKFRIIFFEDLYVLLNKRSEEIGSRYVGGSGDTERINSYFLDHEPLLACAPVSITHSTFIETCQLISNHFSHNAGLDSVAAEVLSDYSWRFFASQVDLSTAGLHPGEFIEECLSRFDDFKVDSALPATVFMMIPSFALRAHLQTCAEELMDKVSADSIRLIPTKSVVCPVCATPAALSVVGTSAGIDGRDRVQYCATCGTVWDYERIRCGVCGTQNQQHLHYFHLEGDETHRLLNCDECGQYERVVFQENISVPLCYEIEDVVMARLEKVALDPRFRSEIQQSHRSGI